MKEKEPRRSQTDKNTTVLSQSEKKTTVSSQSEKKQNNTVDAKMIILGLLLAAAPFLVTYILEIIAYYADFAIVTALHTYLGMNIDFDKASYEGANMPSNAIVTNLIYALLCLVIFGWWLMNVKEAEARRSVSAKAKINRDQKTIHNGNNKNNSPVSSENKTYKPIALLVVLGVSFQLFVSSILAIIRFNAPKILRDYDEMINSLTERTFLMMLTTILLAPIAEELIFRGLTLHFARKVMPVRISIIFSALLFGLYHGNLIQGIYAFVAGMILAYIVTRTGRLLPAVFLHIVINLSAYLLPDVLYETMTPSVLILVMSAGLIFLVFYFSRSPKSGQDICDQL